MTLKVIGAGFGRTGTDSMRHALNMLGLGPTHHMYEVTDNPTVRDHWRALAEGAEPDWGLLLEGYNACVDWPSAHYWRTLIDVYPDAKVVLTWRSPESWWSSFSRTILPVIETSEDPNSLGKVLIREQVFDGRPGDRDHAIATYQRNVDDVIATVPSDRLLVHKLGDGWAPLCAHLGVPIPDDPYPSGNATEAFAARFLTDGDPANER